MMTAMMSRVSSSFIFVVEEVEWLLNDSDLEDDDLRHAKTNKKPTYEMETKNIVSKT